ncbi:MAG: helix-turn-helix transcriptional regulator [Chloroflexota bacterium]|nr:helix-turn-helix transcriptional regulator [Chloroflexota bacterium]
MNLRRHPLPTSASLSALVQQRLHHRRHPLAAVAEADDFEPVHILVHLPLADRQQLQVALAELRLARAAAEQDRQRLARLAAAGEPRLRRAGAELPLHAVEVGVDLVAPLRLHLDHVLHVHDAERDVAALVLRRQPEHALVDLALREHLAHPEHRLHEALTDEVQGRRHLREILRRQQADRARARLQQADAICQRALAEDVEVARLVHDLAGEEEADLEVLAADVRGILARDVTGDELDLREERAELRHRQLDLLGQVGKVRPGHVDGAAPLALHRLFVEQHRRLRPRCRLRGPDHLRVLRVGARRGAAHAPALVARRSRDGAVRRGRDVLERQTPLPRSDAQAALGERPVEPREVEVLAPGFLAKLLQNARTDGHAASSFGPTRPKLLCECLSIRGRLPEIHLLQVQARRSDRSPAAAFRAPRAGPAGSVNQAQGAYPDAVTRRGRPPHPDVLTPRQWEVLELVREGLSNEQIGRRLGISTDGAKFHVSEILTKLGVSSRREAAGWPGEPATAPAPPGACLASTRPAAPRTRLGRARWRRRARHAACGRWHERIGAAAAAPGWRERAA